MTVDQRGCLMKEAVVQQSKFQLIPVDPDRHLHCPRQTYRWRPCHSVTWKRQRQEPEREGPRRLVLPKAMTLKKTTLHLGLQVQEEYPAGGLDAKTLELVVHPLRRIYHCLFKETAAAKIACPRNKRGQKQRRAPNDERSGQQILKSSAGLFHRLKKEEEVCGRVAES